MSKHLPKSVRARALEEASDEEVTRAILLHKRMLSPKYRVAEKVAQTILEDYIVEQQIP